MSINAATEERDPSRVDTEPAPPPDVAAQPHGRVKLALLGMKLERIGYPAASGACLQAAYVGSAADAEREAEAGIKMATCARLTTSALIVSLVGDMPEHGLAPIRRWRNVCSAAVEAAHEALAEARAELARDEAKAKEERVAEAVAQETRTGGTT